MLLAPWRSRRSGTLVTASVGPYRAADLADLVQLAEAGHFRAVIDRTFDLTEIVEAHRFVDTGRKRGNVVLTGLAACERSEFDVTVVPARSRPDPRSVSTV